MLHADLIFQLGEWLTTTQAGVAGEGFGTWGSSGGADTTVLLATPYLGLLTTFPSNITDGIAAGTAAVEYVDNTTPYARLAISGAGFWEWNDTTFAVDTPSSNYLTNQGSVEFAERGPSTSATVVGWAVWNSLTAGTWRYCQEITDAVLTQYDVLRFAAGTLDWTIA